MWRGASRATCYLRERRLPAGSSTRAPWTAGLAAQSLRRLRTSRRAAWACACARIPARRPASTGTASTDSITAAPVRARWQDSVTRRSCHPFGSDPTGAARLWRLDAARSRCPRDRGQHALPGPLGPDPTWDIDVRSYATQRRVEFFVARFTGEARDRFALGGARHAVRALDSCASCGGRAARGHGISADHRKRLLPEGHTRGPPRSACGSS